MQSLRRRLERAVRGIVPFTQLRPTACKRIRRLEFWDTPV